MHQLKDKKIKVTIYLILLIILSTTSGKFTENKETDSLSFVTIEVSGLTNKKNLQITNKLSNFIKKNVFIFNKEKIDNIVSKYNIVEEYTVKKIYPSKLNISIKSTKLIAKVSGKNELFVGANGKLISTTKNKNILPYLFGEYNSTEFLRFKKNIERSKLNFNEFKALYFFPSSRWDILTTDNTLIKLPINDLQPTLNLAHTIINTKYFKNKSIIDLRINNHLIIK
jgi:cell division protein FtsQ